MISSVNPSTNSSCSRVLRVCCASAISRASWNARSPTSMRSSTMRKFFDQPQMRADKSNSIFSYLRLSAFICGCFFCAMARSQTTQSSDYGKEEYRLVNQSDEIVSVLKNGATVIVKRVSSPVMAVRGYVYTGGVYEGQWLGGGLSHLLEHLVAGGSTIKRSEAQNRDLLQKIGNNSNAYTTTDH